MKGFGKLFPLGAIALVLFSFNACSNSTASSATPTLILPITPRATLNAATPRATTTRANVSASKNAKPSPTILKNARRIPETHDGRTQCLTCHEFGTVGPPMPQFHKDDKYDNTMCKRCHQGP